MGGLSDGADFANNLTLNERKTEAYNALNRVYGPAVAGDPDASLKAQEYAQRDLTNPIAVQQAGANLGQTQAVTQGQDLSNAFNTQANPIKVQGLQDANTQAEQSTAFEAQDQPGKIAQQGATLAGTKAQTANTQTDTAQKHFALNTAQGTAMRQTAMGILSSLSDVASAGGDVGATFDKNAALIAQMEGVTPDHLPPLRAALMRDPVGTINQLTDAVNAANTAAMGAGGKGAAGALAMMKFSQGQMSLKDGLNFVQQRTAAVPDLTDQMTSLAGQMSGSAIVRKAKSEIPGTPEYQFEKLNEQLKANTALDDLRTLKATGTSMGRVSNMEMGLSSSAVANMDIGQSPATLLANLKRVKTTYGMVNSNLAADITRIGTGTTMPGQKRAITPGAPGSKFQEGQTYQDAKGNKATFTGGKFVPVQ